MANKFSARHYEVLAGMLAQIRANYPVEDAGEDVGYGKALIDVEHDLTAIFAADNPRFDPERFHGAAQPRALDTASALGSRIPVARHTKGDSNANTLGRIRRNNRISAWRRLG